MTHPAFTDEVTRVRDTVDDWGEKTHDLEKSYPCKVVSTSRTLVNENGKTLQLSYEVLFDGDVDLVHSDKLKISGTDYTIIRIEPVSVYGSQVWTAAYV